MTILSEKWVHISKKLLNKIKRLEVNRERDSLALVRSMRLMVYALKRGLMRWTQSVNNPDIMTRFTQKDLEQMSKELSKFTCSFIEYDLEATKVGTERGLKVSKKVRKKKERNERFYV
jgi:hypothetical protein